MAATKGRSDDVRVAGDCVYLDGGRYEIELRRIPNHAAMVEWIFHLSEKTWVDSRVIASFINEVAAAKGWEIYGHDPR